MPKVRRKVIRKGTTDYLNFKEDLVRNRLIVVGPGNPNLVLHVMNTERYHRVYRYFEDNTIRVEVYDTHNYTHLLRTYSTKLRPARFSQDRTLEAI